MNKRGAYKEGYDRGYGIALSVEVEDGEDLWDTCFEAEDNSRQYSDFSFLAHDLNTSRYPDSVWEGYEDGVVAGIRAGVRKRGGETIDNDIQADICGAGSV